MDYSAYTDDEIDAICTEVIAERERRHNLSRIPEQVADLRRAYVDGGGDPAVLEQAVNPDPEPPTE